MSTESTGINGKYIPVTGLPSMVPKESQWPKGMVYYPKFSCAAEEIGWLQVQYSRLCGEVGFLKHLRALQYDVSESMVQLKDLYKLKLEEMTKERDFLMAEVARLACHDPQKKYVAPPAAFPRGRWASKDQGGLG